jgi:hypothetical protein
VKDDGDVSNTYASYQHDFDHAVYGGKGSLVCSFEIADRLFTAGFAKIILSAVVFFAISYYVRTMAVGTIKFYVDYHSFIVFLFVLTVFLFHHTF